MSKKPYCTGCKKEGHYVTFCYFTRKTQPKVRNTAFKSISERLSKKDVADIEFKHQWIHDNATPSGYWDCYLQISPMCLKAVNVETLTIEHVIPKGRGIEYRYDKANVKPSCAFCNALKGSRTLDSLAKQYPHLGVYIK